MKMPVTIQIDQIDKELRWTAWAFMLTLLLGMMLMLAAGCEEMTGKTAGGTLDDAVITTSVKSKLMGEKTANLMRVDVDTNNGIVQLSGVVDSPAQKTQAEQLALQVKGVKSVVNHLQVQPIGIGGR